MNDPASSSDASRGARIFVERISAGDVEGIVALMTDDHEFIDTAGSAYQGREGMRAGWASYFRLFPDYHIVIERVLVDESVVTLVGRSTGTLSEHGREVLRRSDGSLPPNNELQGPAIWMARTGRAGRAVARLLGFASRARGARDR